MLILSTLIQLLILAAVVVAVGRVVRRGRPGRSDATATLRRFFTYGLLASSVGIAAAGVWGLIVRAIEPPLVADDGTTALARSLAFTIVGLPAAFGLLRYTLVRLETDPDESASLAWRFYVSAATAVSLLTTMIAGYLVVGSLFGLEDGGAGAIATLIVGGGVWVMHWLTPLRRHHPPSGIHLMLGSLFGLTALVGGAGVIVERSLDRLYANWFGVELAASDPGDMLARSLIVIVIGATVWAWHWLRPSALEWSQLMWHGWVLIGGVLPGVLVVIGAAASVLFGILVWVLGDRGGETAAAFFDFLPGAVAASLVGATVAWYHHRAHAVAVTARTEAARAYDYLLAAVGLSAVLTGVTTLLVAFFTSISSPAAAGGDSSVNILLAAVVGIAIGAPLWVRYWGRCERHAATDPGAELASTSRRAFVLAVLGISAVVGLISVIVVLFLFLEDALAATLGSSTLYDLRFAVPLVVTAGAGAWYHFSVFRRDQPLRPETAVVALKHVVVVTSNRGALVERLRSVEGFTVDRWEIIGRGSTPAGDPEAVVAAIGDAAGSDVLVMEDPDGAPIVLAYRPN